MTKLKKCKKVFFLSIVLTLLLGGVSVSAESASVKGAYIDYILEYQPGLTVEELNKFAEEISEVEGMTVEEVISQIYKELKADIDKGKEEKKNSLAGGNDGAYRLDKGITGHIYYTDSWTGALDVEINHGHVGIYTSMETLAEAVPSVGVRSINIKTRKVHYGAVRQKVNGTGSWRVAAEWADSRVGKDAYNPYFFNNKKRDGRKNCSQLVWVAYSTILREQGLSYVNLDSNGGLGVYPKDIRDSPHTVTVKTITQLP